MLCHIVLLLLVIIIVFIIVIVIALHGCVVQCNLIGKFKVTIFAVITGLSSLNDLPISCYCSLLVFREE